MKITKEYTAKMLQVQRPIFTCDQQENYANIVASLDDKFITCFNCMGF